VGAGDQVVAQADDIQPGSAGKERLDVVGDELFVEAYGGDGDQGCGQLQKVDWLWIRDSRLLGRFI
jgi:hypothetical protein